MNNQPGLNCPECNFRIPVSIEQLISSVAITCPSCGLKLEIEQEKSKPAIDAAKKLNTALKKAK